MGDFLSAAELALYTQTDVDAATANLLIAGAEAAARRFCGWSLTEETVVGLVVTATGDRLFLPTLHLTAVASITEDGAALTVGTGYRWKRSGEVVRYGRRAWSSEWEAVVVSFTHGYPAGASELADIKGILGAAVARRIGNPALLQQMQLGDAAEMYAVSPNLPNIALLSSEKGELESYRIPVMA